MFTVTENLVDKDKLVEKIRKDEVVQPKQLAETFDISVEKAHELLIKSGYDIERANPWPGLG